MARRAATESDIWFGIVDPRKRKKVQDRLAQRARRKRLAEGKARRDQRQLDSDIPRTTLPSPSPSLDETKDNDTSEQISMPPIQSLIQHAKTPLTSDYRLPSLPIHTVYSALFHNGVILGLACSTSSTACSAAASLHVPASLRPTALQLQTVHYQWIDRIPLATVRDSLIKHCDVYNSEELLGDIFSSPSFSITPGCMSWDPKGWKVDGAFREKWWFLFEDL